jgi:uncharacterized protein (TIGR02466 family)
MNKETREINIQNLFPTPVGQSNIGRDFTNGELSFIKNQKKYKSIGNLVSTESNLLDKIEMFDIKDRIQGALDAYYNYIFSPKTKAEIYITQSWANYTNNGQFHHAHMHSNSYISGVLYIQTFKDDSIHFTRPNVQTSFLHVEPVEQNLWNSQTWWIGTNSAELLLFPSTLVHEVRLRNNPGTRISISFNTFLRGDIGNREMRTGLTLT